MKKIRRNLANCKRRKNEEIVQNGLALTPAQILKMAEAGIPASSANNPNLVDGSKENNWIVPIEERRGIDMADLWNERQDIKQRFVNAHSKSVSVEPIKTT